MSKTISGLVLEYFQAHPNEELQHGDVVDWVTEQYLQDHDTPPRDPWRAIRKLYEEGMLVKVKKGVYKYDPDLVKKVELDEFTSDIKEKIFKRDGYRCVVCGRGRKDGVEICADHIIPKNKGGTSTLENGQTLCSEHNLLKKNYSGTEAGKRYFVKLYETAVANNDERMIRFIKDIFDTYDEHGINSHIPRPNREGL